MNNETIMEDVLYGNVLVKLKETGFVDSVTGDVYISHTNLRKVVLGFRCHIPYDKQMRIIQNLHNANIISINKTSPACLYRNLTKGEIFYCMKKEIAEKL